MPPTIHALYGEKRVKFVIRGGAVNLKAIRERFQLSHADLDGVYYTEDEHGWSEDSDFKEGDTVTVTGDTFVAAAAAQPPAAQPDPFASVWAASGKLPSASAIGNAQKHFVRFQEVVKPRDFRPQRGTPLPLVSPVFATFLDIWNSTGLPPHCYYSAALELGGVLSQVYQDEVREMHPPVYDCLTKFFAGIGITDQLQKAAQGASVPDILLTDSAGGPSVLFELATDTGGNKYGQGMRYYQSASHAAKDTQQFRTTPLPAFLVEMQGPYLHISGLAWEQHLLCEPLAHVACILEDGHVDAVARALHALGQAVLLQLRLSDAAGEQQATTRLASLDFPHPLREMYPGAALSRTPSRTLFFVMPAGTQEQVAVKFVRTNSELPAMVQSQWAALGLAPTVRRTQRVSGEWLAVEMDKLGDGWESLYAVRPAQPPPKEGRSRLATAAQPQWDTVSRHVEAALERAHTQALIPGPNGELAWLTVHGDMRLNNVMVRLTAEGEWQLRFVDFDWSGWAGHTCYPAMMNPEIHWPTGAGQRLTLQQQHDKQLLSVELQVGGIPFKA